MTLSRHNRRASPPSPDRPASRSLPLLQHIADTLGVGFDAPRETSARRLFHGVEDGTGRFLVSGRSAFPPVATARRTSGRARLPRGAVKTAQGQAMTFLIDRLLLNGLR